jgi:hypothetical protein
MFEIFESLNDYYDAGFEQALRGLRLPEPEIVGTSEEGLSCYVDGFFDYYQPEALLLGNPYPLHYIAGNYVSDSFRSLLRRQVDYVCCFSRDTKPFPEPYAKALGIYEWFLKDVDVYIYDPLDLYPLSTSRYQWTGSWVGGR